MTSAGKLGFLLVVISVFIASAAAQDAQRFETFGGYSFTHSNAFFTQGSNLSGWDTTTTVFLKRWFGVTSDFSGHYGAANTTYPATPDFTPAVYRDTAHAHNFLFGPHFTYRRSRYAPFIQTLFGVQHTWVSSTLLAEPICPPLTCTNFPPVGTTSSGSTTNFAMAAGGGLDIALGHGLWLRPVQAEYLLDRACCHVVVRDGVFHSYGYNVNSFRYSTGITFRFGGHLGGKK